MTEFTDQRVISLQAENYKRLKAVTITPDEAGLVQITGANAQGKSSVLDALWSALDNAATSKQNPDVIRHGERRAHVRLELDDLVIERTWLSGKSPALKVTSKEGAKLSSPQQVLNSLLSSLSFDPTAFLRLRPAGQVSQLLSIVDLKIDLDAVAELRQATFDSRTEVNREVTRLRGVVDSLELPGEVPERVNVSALMQELDRANAANREREKVNDQIAYVLDQIDDLERELAKRKAQSDDLLEQQAALDEELTTHRPVPDIENDLRTADDRNNAAREYEQLLTVTAELNDAQAKSEDLTQRIAELDAEKRDALENADMPVPGLGFDDTGVTYQGVPLVQASTAERLRVATAIAMRNSPELKVIRIQDGNDLDSKSLAALEQQAVENGYQVWIERVDESGEVGVFIEDGEIGEKPVDF